MADDHTPIYFIPPFGRASRGRTRLQHLSLRRASGEKTPVNIDVNTGVAFGSDA